MNESSSNNENNPNKNYKVKSDLLKIQSEINLDSSHKSHNREKDNTPSNSMLDKLIPDENLSPRNKFRKVKNNSDAHIHIKEEVEE